MVEYENGCERVTAVAGNFGYEIARLRSSTEGAAELREELYAIVRGRHRVSIGGATYELRAQVHDSFGEHAFRVPLRRV